jgi:hypothetical protein
MSLTPVANVPLVLLTPEANLPPVSTTLAYLVAKFATPVIDIRGKFAAGVVDTSSAPWLANIYANFHKKFWKVLMGYSGATGILIHDKNQTLSL